MHAFHRSRHASYACHTAASFIIALIRSGRLANVRPLVTGPDVMLMQDAGNFPTFINVIVDELNAATKGTIFISCDYAGYGMFSAGETFDRYMSALRAAHARGCKIEMLLDCTMERRRRLRDDGPSTATDDAAFRRLRNDPQFADRLAELETRMTMIGLRTRDLQPTSWSRVEWLQALEKLEEYYREQLRQFVHLSITMTRIPVYMWIAGARAIWALSSLDPNDRFQMDVQMSDGGVNPDDGELPWVEYAYVSDDRRFVTRLRQLWHSYERAVVSP